MIDALARMSTAQPQEANRGERGGCAEEEEEEELEEWEKRLIRRNSSTASDSAIAMPEPETEASTPVISKRNSVSMKGVWANLSSFSSEPEESSSPISEATLLTPAHVLQSSGARDDNAPTDKEEIQP